MSGLTIVDIAKLAGVGVSTVSRVINKHPDVSVATTEKVMAIIDQYGYVPNVSARNLKRESAKAIGMVVKDFTNPAFTTMLKIIQREIERNGYSLILAQVDPNQDEAIEAISLCKEKKPRGLILMGGNFRRSHDKLNMLDAPYVMVSITLEDAEDRENFSSVTVDDYEAGCHVAEMIYDAGHRKVAVMGAGTGDISISKLRIDGFLKAWSDHGLMLEDERIAYSGKSTYKAGYETAMRLQENVEFSCLFCISDIQAIGAMRAIHEKGNKIPGDISVVGFDGVEEGIYHIPSLATMRQPFSEMANVSVRILLNHIRSGSPHEHHLFRTEVYSGESFAEHPAGCNDC